MVFLCPRKQPGNPIIGRFVMIAWSSRQSRRVAHATMKAETLAGMAGLEECLVLQLWLYELEHPGTSPWDLM